MGLISKIYHSNSVGMREVYCEPQGQGPKKKTPANQAKAILRRKARRAKKLARKRR